MGGRLHLFSIYTDFGAYRRIKWTINSIARLAGPHWQCSSEMWKLDSLITSEPLKKMLADDGANADVLIAVVGSLKEQRPELFHWLDSLAPLEPHRRGLLIGLLGDEEEEEQEVDWTTRQLIRCAEKSNRKFIWHWMGHHVVDSPDWLAESIRHVQAGKQTMQRSIEPMPVPEILQEAVGAI